MRRWIGLLVIAGCAGDGGSKDSGAETGGDTSGDTTPPDTDTTPPDTTPPDTDTDTGVDCTTTFTGPTVLDVVDVKCNVEQTDVDFYAETIGWTTGSMVFAIETANVSPWSEEHDLVSFEYDACGGWDHLDLFIPAGDGTGDLDDYVRGQSSFFTCSDHYDAEDVMTYAFAVWDVNGDLADCNVGGHDPEGLVNGDYDSVMVLTPSFPLTDCVTVTIGG